MAVVYYYIPKGRLEDVTECGLKLSEWSERTQATPWNRQARPCICAFLHPLDDKRSRDNTFSCITLDVPAEDCVVADGDLYQMGLEYPEITDKYVDTMVSLNDYTFGSFRKPECLVFRTILPEQIGFYGKGMGEPVIYENSEMLYVNIILEQYRERNYHFNQVLLYSFLALKEQNSCIDALYSKDRKTAVFFDNKINRYITIAVPDLKSLGGTETGQVF
ncbi:MAG: hypothetical protein GX757_12105 [Clostridiales bacterium]|jgi:hypothetical protein|nr:hypothetical protein [Clostridiales bacterium]